MPTVLITGATGFVGTSCLRQGLAEDRADIHAVARRVPNQPLPNCRFHALDLFDATAVRELLRAVRPTHLLHLAWITTPGHYWTSPENQHWVNASLDLLRSFVEAGGRRAVITGTCAEYDWWSGGVCHETQTPLRPATVYGRCKDQLRRGAEDVSRTSGLSLAWARLFFLYGPSEHPARLIPSVVQSLLSGRPAQCTAGKQQRDFLHVDDAAHVLLKLLFADGAGSWNVASGEATSIRAIVERLGILTGRPELLRLGERPTPANEPPLLVGDIGRLREELGWKPQIAMDQGLANVVSWWRGQVANAS